RPVDGPRLLRCAERDRQLSRVLRRAEELLHQPRADAVPDDGARQLRALQGDDARRGADGPPRRHRDLPLRWSRAALSRGDGESRAALARHARGRGGGLSSVRLLRLRPARRSDPPVRSILALQGKVRRTRRAPHRISRRHLLRPARGRRGADRGRSGRSQSMMHGLETLVMLAVCFALCFLGKLAYGLFHPSTNVDRELTARDNFAFALQLGGYYLGILIAVGAPLTSPGSGDLRRDVVSVALWGLLAIVLLNLASLIKRQLALRSIDLAREVVERGNVAAGIVLAGVHLANALLVLGALSGEG